MSREALGEFEQLVLLALVRLADDGYGVSIHGEIAHRTRRHVSLAAVYKTLDRLEQKGFAASWLGDATRERGGRRKKHFRIQPAGRRVLKASLASIGRMADGLAGNPAFDIEP